jgi:hypothetical protein
LIDHWAATGGLTPADLGRQGLVLTAFRSGWQSLDFLERGWCSGFFSWRTAWYHQSDAKFLCPLPSCIRQRYPGSNFQLPDTIGS